MKRGIIGAALLAGLLAGGLFSTLWLGRRLEPLPPLLEQAAGAARDNRWEAAELLSDRAEQTWQQVWRRVAVFTDHAPMEQIDALFAQLEVCQADRVFTDYRKLCVRLSSELEALAESHCPNWWNLL